MPFGARREDDLLFGKLDRYLLKQFLITLVVVILAIGLTIISINMVEQLRDFIDHDIPMLKILEYYVYFGGWVLRSFFPVFVLLATLFSVTILSRRNEFLAIKASGISLYRVTLPYLLLVAVLAAGHFYYNEYLYPPLNRQRIEIKEFTIERRSKRQFTNVSNLFRQIRPGYFYTIATLDVERREGKDLKVLRTEENRLVEMIVASRVTYDDTGWVAREGTRRVFADSAEERFVSFSELPVPDIVDRPDELAKRLGKPEDMGYDQLKSYIALLQRVGMPSVREQIDLNLKLAYPVTSIIVVLLALPFAAQSRRGGIAVSFAAGALIALAYFVLFRVLQSAGYNERIPEYAAVWGINAFFALIALVLFRLVRK